MKGGVLGSFPTSVLWGQLVGLKVDRGGTVFQTLRVSVLFTDALSSLVRLPLLYPLYR